MTDQVDTGFEDVIAGEVYSHEVEVRPAPPAVPHVCAGAGATCDTCFAPITVAVNPGLTDEGKQAAKALVALPPLDFPTLAKLAREIAMDIKERHVILAEHRLNEAQYDFLEANNEFYAAALAAACKDWHAPLTTQERIKVEAAAILEDSLLGLGARMQNKSEGLPGVIEAAKLFAKVAGVGEQEGRGLPPGERFTINIDLGGDQKITVESTPAPSSAAGDAVGRALPAN